MTNQLEDRVIAVEEFASGTGVEITLIHNKLDTMGDRLRTVERGVGRVEAGQVEHTRRFTGIEQRLESIEGDVSTLKSDVSTLKGDVSTLKSDVAQMKSDLSDFGGLLTQILAAVETGE